MASDFRSKLRKWVFKRPPTVPADFIKGPTKPSKEDLEELHKLGVVLRRGSIVDESLQLSLERFNVYREIDYATYHWMMGAALELYSDFATVYDPVIGRTVWITGENKSYANELTKLFDQLGIEEKIFDWAWTTSAYGDHFVKINAAPGVGIISIEDDDHPVNVSRLDYNGVLCGFYRTPTFGSGGLVSKQENLSPPWDWVHFRLLGVKRKRPVYGDPSFAEFRTVHLMSPDTRKISSKYGYSLIMNALPLYRRLRLVEDCLLLTRLTKGIEKWVWKVKVSGCLSGSTKIHLLDGTSPTIQEMFENSSQYIGKSVLTVEEKNLHLKSNRIKNITLTRRNSELVRVHLDNDKHVDCTPDHRFMLRDGSYREAQYLQLDESLMPLYSKIKKKDADHKVVQVEWLDKKEDVYDLEIENTPNFPLEIGIFVHNSNASAVNAILNEVQATLRKARALNVDPSDPNYDQKFNPLSAIEDIVIPVWDDINDMAVEKIGGSPDIKWIADQEELRNELACALRVPLPLLGGFIEDATGALGSTSLEKLDMRFARNARRVQRALIEGLTRMAQIHLAFQGKDPDPRLFKINMGATSTAEEDQVRLSLDLGLDAIDKIMTISDTLVTPESDFEVDKVGLLNYFNRKILKLGDFDAHTYIIKKKPSFSAPVETSGGEHPVVHKTPPEVFKNNFPQDFKKGVGEEIPGPPPEKLESYRPMFNTDLRAALPIQEQKISWETDWGKAKVIIETSNKKGKK